MIDEIITPVDKQRLPKIKVTLKNNFYSDTNKLTQDKSLIIAEEGNSKEPEIIYICSVQRFEHCSFDTRPWNQYRELKTC